MGIGVLGPIVVEGSGSVSPRDRVLLSVLVVRRGEVVSADQLADVLWGEDLPESWRKVVQGSVVRLRKTLGAAAIETTPGGYRLVAGDDDVDAWQFEHLVGRAAELSETDEHDRAAELLARAQTLWRGEPLADLSRWPAGQAEATRLLELRRRAEENQVAARLALGEHRDVVARAAALAAEEPLREERWTLLATALYRAGRQGEALRCLNDARHILSEQLGVAPGPELLTLEQAILDQDRGLDAPIPAQVGARAECPYQGLEAYDEAQADEFFGRDVETTECRRRLADHGFLAIVGPSGSGKSSLVRAGLVAGLKAEGRGSVVCVPGPDPTGALLVALAATTFDTVLVVDQGEELFTVCSDPIRRERFAIELAAQAEHRPVVITLRADHIGGLVAFPDLARLVESGLYLLGPMGEPDLRAAIEGPARDAGLRLEAGLVDLLVRDVLGQPGALPLLSHALVETWARREGRVMTVDAYRASGGVQGAVARTAEQLYESLSDPQRHDARALFLRLVSVERDGQPVRHRLQRSMLARDQDEIAGTLVRARLLTAGDGSLEIAHEALADAWPRLQHWLDEDRDGQRVLTHLSASAQDWSTRGDSDDLYRGPRLAAAHEWVTRTGFELSEVEASFLTASDAGRDAEAEALAARSRAHAETNRRLRLRLRVGALLLVIALVAICVAVAKGRQANNDRRRAELASRSSALQNAVSQSLGLRSSRRDVAALLAAEAYRLHPGAETESAMLATVTGAPDFAGYLWAGAGQPWAAALDADGGRLVVSDTTSTARIFDTASMRLVHVIKPPRPRFYGVVALSPDASVTVMASSRAQGAPKGGALSAYDTRTGRARFPEVELSFDPGDVVISPDGRWVAVSGGPEGNTSVLDLRTGATVASIAPAPHGDGPNEVNTAALAFIASDRLAVGSEIGLIRIVQPATGAVLQSIAGAAGFAETRIFPTPDGRSLVTSGVAGTTVIDLATGAARWPARLGVSCNRVAADFKLGVVLCSDPFGRVQSFDLATGVEVPQRFDFQQGFVSSIAVSGDGSTLALTGGVKGAVGVWRLDGSGPLQHKIGSGIGSAVEYDPAGTALLVARTTTEPRSYRVVDPETDRTIDPLDGVVNASWSGRRNIIGVVHANGTGALYDVSAHRQVKGTRIKLPFTPVQLVPDQARHRIILLDRDGHVQGVRGGRLVGPHLALRRAPNAAAITPDGRYLLVASDAHGTETYDLASDGKRVAAAPALSQLTLSRGGILAAARPDGEVGLYDPRTLRPRGLVPAIAGGVVAMQLSADGRRLALEGWDGTLRLIDVTSRRGLGDPIPVANRDVYVRTVQLPLRSDGRQVAVDLEDGIATWDVGPERLVQAACTIAGRNLTPTEWRRNLSRMGGYHRTCRTRA